MNNILLVGNGFDLAHGLPTSYNDFLFLLKNWDKFYAEYEDMRRNPNVDHFRTETLISEYIVRVENRDESIDRFLKVVSPMDKEFIDKLCIIVHDNSWVKYYCNCEAEIDGWIDFEREIYPVITMFECIFNAQYEIEINTRLEYAEARIGKENLGADVFRTAKLWKKYVDVKNPDFLIVNAEYTSKSYGILKKKILEDLRKEFDVFTYAFELYLNLFVCKRHDIKIIKQIEDIGINKVVSFNYTPTESLYGIKEEDVHHIHGLIRDDLSAGKNNMVMGVNENDEQNIEFIYFVKYFQRIQKASGVRYKDYIYGDIDKENGVAVQEQFNLYIYGHSLDETDEDILRYFIGCEGEYGRLEMQPEHVVIFYYDQADFEQKVINLIKLYGRYDIEKYMELGKIEFVQTSNE